MNMKSKCADAIYEFAPKYKFEVKFVFVWVKLRR